VASLCEVARVTEAEARLLEKEGKTKGGKRKDRASDTSISGGSNSKGAVSRPGEGAGAGRAARLLRVLIAAFNAFLRPTSQRGGVYSKTYVKESKRVVLAPRFFI